MNEVVILAAVGAAALIAVSLLIVFFLMKKKRPEMVADYRGLFIFGTIWFFVGLVAMLVFMLLGIRSG